jgi:hypothetical protein
MIPKSDWPCWEIMKCEGTESIQHLQGLYRLHAQGREFYSHQTGNADHYATQERMRSRLLEGLPGNDLIIMCRAGHLTGWPVPHPPPPGVRITSWSPACASKTSLPPNLFFLFSFTRIFSPLSPFFPPAKP